MKDLSLENIRLRFFLGWLPVEALICETARLKSQTILDLGNSLEVTRKELML